MTLLQDTDDLSVVWIQHRSAVMECRLLVGKYAPWKLTAQNPSSYWFLINFWSRKWPPVTYASTVVNVNCVNKFVAVKW